MEKFQYDENDTHSLVAGVLSQSIVLMQCLQYIMFYFLHINRINNKVDIFRFHFQKIYLIKIHNNIKANQNKLSIFQNTGNA